MNILFTPTEAPRSTPNCTWKLSNSKEHWEVREITVAGATEKDRVCRALAAATQQAAFGEWRGDTPRPDTNATDLWGTATGIVEAATRKHLAAVVFRGQAWELGTVVHGLVLGEAGIDALACSRMSAEQGARHLAKPAILGALYADLSPPEAATRLPEHCNYYDMSTGQVVSMEQSQEGVRAIQQQE